jgi:cephalosporin hydroxylase
MNSWRWLLGKLGHVNGNTVQADLNELKDATHNIKNEISALTADLARFKSNLDPDQSQKTKSISEQFHIMYYDHPQLTWQNTFWFGIPVQKYPGDLWIYQEILFELKPDIIVETGTFNGGSALFLASVCDILKRGQIITIDIEPREKRPKHPRIKYLTGSSIAPDTIRRVKEQIHEGEKVLVILDSDHSKQHVLVELEKYSPLVTNGSYIIVEDSNVNGHPVFPQFGPGPMEAIDEFLVAHREFLVDVSREKFYMTANPQGYLKKSG